MLKIAFDKNFEKRTYSETLKFFVFYDKNFNMRKDIKKHESTINCFNIFKI